MKRIFILFIMMFVLVGCTSDKESVSVVCPTGAPSIVFYNEIENENFETNNVPSDIVSLMASDKGSDIVVIDAVSGISAINKGADYALAGIITFGNFYIASTGNDDNKTLDKDDTIVLFGQNQSPDIMFSYLYGNDYANIIFETNVSDAAKDLITGKDINGNPVDYVFIAEPALTNAKNKNPNVEVYANIQEIYTEKTNKTVIQAGLFVRKDAKKETKEYLENLEKNINNLLVNSDELNSALKDQPEELVSAKYGISLQVMLDVLKDNRVGIGYKKAIDIKDDIDEYLSLMGKEKTSEEIYFK